MSDSRSISYPSSKEICASNVYILVLTRTMGLYPNINIRDTEWFWGSSYPSYVIHWLTRSNVYMSAVELAWRSGSVMDCNATVRGSIPVVFTELHILRNGQ